MAHIFARLSLRLETQEPRSRRERVKAIYILDLHFAKSTWRHRNGRGWFHVKNPEMKRLDQMQLVCSLCDKKWRGKPDRLIAHLNHSNKVKDVLFCERVPSSVKELWKTATSKNIPNFKMWEATHRGAVASSTPEVSVGVDSVECVGSQGTASSSGVVGGVGIATPYGRALNRHIVGVGSSSFRSSQGHRARIEETLTPPSG